MVLTLASILFYLVGEWRFLGWLLVSIILNYFIALGIESNRNTVWAKRLLVVGIASDLALLVVFKYSGFIVANVNTLLSTFHVPVLPTVALLLPLGISFFTFHKISYQVDVFRGVSPARKSLVDLALYILLFPQLIAGPIVRFNEIANELSSRMIYRADIVAGSRRFIIGLGKKMMLANPVALTADTIFALPATQLHPSVAWLGIICYSLQIYFDFSGYSDMAIGLARIFGFKFPENFNYPYIATSMTDFWRRWHISLSRFLRDYLYIPLGGNRVSATRTYFNLSVVFLLCGMWHGASWCFIIWGAYHGLLLIAERMGTLRIMEKWPQLLRHALTLVLIMIGWVFFRADSMQQALSYFKAMSGFAEVNVLAAGDIGKYLNNEVIITIIIGCIVSTPILPETLHGLKRWRRTTSGIRLVTYDLVGSVARISIYVGILLYSISAIAAKAYNPFIYYRF